MKTKNIQLSITVNATAQEAFKRINEVTKWWTENLKGNSQKLNDEFNVWFGDVHRSTQKLVELVPDKKVVWLVTDSRLNFIDDKEEWTNTKIVFDIISEGNKTTIQFTHDGLGECYDACSSAWGSYIKDSLANLITTGKGKPEPKI